MFILLFYISVVIKKLHIYLLSISKHVCIESGVYIYILNSDHGGRNDPVVMEDIGNTLLDIVEGAAQQEKEAEQKLIEEQMKREKKLTYKLFQKILYVNNWFHNHTTSILLTHSKKTLEQLDDSVSIPSTTTTMETEKNKKMKNTNQKNKVELKPTSPPTSSSSHVSQPQDEENLRQEHGLALSACDHLQAAGVLYFEKRSNYEQARRVFEKSISIAESHGFERCESRYWLSRSYLSLATSLISSSSSSSSSSSQRGNQLNQRQREQLKKLLNEGLKHVEVATSPSCPLKVSKPSIEVRSLLIEMGRS
jgi:hypothetical protein